MTPTHTNWRPHPPEGIPVVCTDRGTHKKKYLGRLTKDGLTAFDGIPQTRTRAMRCPTCRRDVPWTPQTARSLYDTLVANGMLRLDISTL